MIGFLVQALFFGIFLLPPVLGIVFIGVMVHLYRKSDKDRKEHPEKYKNEKPDNFVYME